MTPRTFYCIGETVIERIGQRENWYDVRSQIVSISRHGRITTTTGRTFNSAGMSTDDEYRSIRSTAYPTNQAQEKTP